MSKHRIEGTHFPDGGPALATAGPCDEGVIRGTRGPAPCRKSSRSWVIAAASLGSGMAFLDSTVLNVALPVLQTDLGATARDVQWIYGAFALVLSALLIVGGTLGDSYGRRRAFVLGAVVFAAASVWCALAPGPGHLVAARAVQGAGAALLVPASLAIVGASFEGKLRAKAIGAWGALSGTAMAAGPVLGGWLVEEVSWRAAFLIVPVLASAAVPIAMWHVPESRNPEARRPDVAGALLATGGLVGLVYGLIESSASGFDDPTVLTALFLGVLFLVAFVLVERRVKDPMVPLSLFRSRSFGGANLVTLLFYVALTGSLYLVPFLMMQVHGYSATAAGSAFLPFVAMALLLGRLSGRICARFGARLPLVVASLAVAAGLLLFALPGAERGSYWISFFPAMVVQGFGMALIITPLTTAVLGSVGSERSGLASGINNAVTRMAGLLAVALLGMILYAAFSANLDARLEGMDLPREVQTELESAKADLGAAEVPEGVEAGTSARIERAIDESFVAGFRVVMLVSAGLALASALSAALLIGGKVRPARVDVPALRAMPQKGAYTVSHLTGGASRGALPTNGLWHARDGGAIRRTYEKPVGPKSRVRSGPSPDVGVPVRNFTEDRNATRAKEAGTMYQVSDTETIREHRRALLMETEESRLARQLKMTRTNTQGLAWGRALVAGLLLAAVLAVSLVLAAGKPAHAAKTFTVNRTADFADPDLADGECGFFSGRGGRACSLRAAIEQANATGGPDTILFNIPDDSSVPGPEVKTIAPASELPQITEQVTIDGYSQSGSSINTQEQGTDAVLKIQLDGSSADGNFIEGLDLGTGASNSVVKGLAINRFDGHGIDIFNATGVKIEGNFIGTDSSGTLDLGNGSGGLLVRSDSNTVGGTSRFQRNLISGNSSGVSIIGFDRTATGNKLQGNLIGTAKDGTSDLGNDEFGVAVVDEDRNFIGDFSRSGANTIAFNGAEGVLIAGSGASGNRVLSNSIFDNGRLGIDLQGGIENTAGATKNDPKDPDGGPNDLQNKPVITSAVTSGGKTTINAKLNSTPSDNFFVQFFSNPSGNEGKKLIGSENVSTNSSGNIAFTFTPSQAVAVGQTVTATALDLDDGDTSEFSVPRSVAAS